MSEASSFVSVKFPTAVPLLHKADVIVVGGGPGGIGAAVAAARLGADVLLVEHYGFLGGMATAGEINPFMPNNLDGKSLDTGIYEEWCDRMVGYGGFRTGSRVFDPYVARLAAEDLCLEAGVRLLFHHRTAHVERAGRQISTLVLHSKSGFTAAQAATYIDCTGDGDLAALAGAKFNFGAEDTGFAQPMTLCFKLKLDPQDAPAGVVMVNGKPDLYKALQDQWPKLQEVFKKAKEDGRLQCPRENVLIFRGVEDDMVHFNTTRVIQHDGTNGASLSDAEIQARRQLRQLVAVLKSDMPIFKNCRICSIAPQIGIRETRRITGRAVVTYSDYTVGRRFPDCVARVTYPIDIHNPLGTGTVIEHMPKGSWYEIPFRAMLPVEIDNLVIGSRCISVDHAVHSSVRVMPPVCSIGQAAGTAAAIAKKQNIPVCAVNGAELVASLVKQGRNLEPYDPARPVLNPEATPNARLQQLAAKYSA